MQRRKSRTIVEYALHDARKPIGVATYRTQRTLPKAFARSITLACTNQQVVEGDMNPSYGQYLFERLPQQVGWGLRPSIEDVFQTPESGTLEAITCDKLGEGQTVILAWALGGGLLPSSPLVVLKRFLLAVLFFGRPWLCAIFSNSSNKA